MPTAKSLNQRRPLHRILDKAISKPDLRLHFHFSDSNLQQDTNITYFSSPLEIQIGIHPGGVSRFKPAQTEEKSDWICFFRCNNNLTFFTRAITLSLVYKKLYFRTWKTCTRTCTRYFRGIYDCFYPITPHSGNFETFYQRITSSYSLLND